MRKVKNPHDVRFMRSAQKLRHTINQSYRRHVANIRVRYLTRQSGLSKSAFYDRYHDVNDAVRHLEREIVRDFRRNLRRFTPHHHKKALYTNLLLFIQRNYEDFDAAIERQSYGPIITLLSEIHPFVARDWPHYRPATYQQLFYLYAGEATFTIINWVKQTKCHPDTINLCVQQLITIEHSIPRRFRELVTADYPDATTIPEITKLLTRMEKASEKAAQRSDQHDKQHDRHHSPPQ